MRRLLPALLLILLVAAYATAQTVATSNPFASGNGRIHILASAPTVDANQLAVGDLWYDTTNGILKVTTAITPAVTFSAVEPHLHIAAVVVGGTFNTARLGSGAADATVYLRGDSTWASLDAAHLTTGTVGTARLGSGVADATTYLRGDGSWQVPPSATGITSLGGQVGAAQAFGNDTNVTVSSAADTHTLGWTGQLAVGRGGTGLSTIAAGKLIYASALDTYAALTLGSSLNVAAGTLDVAANTVVEKVEVAEGAVLKGTRKRINFSGATVADNPGTDSVDVTIVAAGGGITSLNGLNAASQNFMNDTNVTIVSSSPNHTITWAGQLGVTRGGTGLASIASGKLLYASGTDVLAALTLDSTLGISAGTMSVQANTTNQKVRVGSAGALVGTRKEINFVSGASVVDNAGSDRVDVTISGGGGGGIGSLNGLTAGSQTFTNDTNVTITSTPGGTVHALGWTGTLAAARGGTGLGTVGANYSVLTSNGSVLSYSTTPTLAGLTTNGTVAGTLSINAGVTAVDATSWGQALARAGKNATATASEYGLAIQVNVTGATGAGSTYEKAGLIVQTRTSDPSTVSILRNLVAVDGRASIASGNSTGRAWGSYHEARVESGGDGYAIAGEFATRNDGTNQSSVGSTLAKYGLHVVSTGTNPGTAALYINRSGTSTWHHGIVADPSVFQTAATDMFLNLVAKWSVTTQGYQTLTQGTYASGFVDPRSSGLAPIQVLTGSAGAPISTAMPGVFVSSIARGDVGTADPTTHPSAIKGQMRLVNATSLNAYAGAFLAENTIASSPSGVGAIGVLAMFASRATNAEGYGLWAHVSDNGFNTHFVGIEVNTVGTYGSRAEGKARGINIVNAPGGTSAANDWGILISGYGRGLVLDGATTSGTMAPNPLIYVRANRAVGGSLLAYEAGAPQQTLGLDFTNGSFVSGEAIRMPAVGRVGFGGTGAYVERDSGGDLVLVQSGNAWIRVSSALITMKANGGCVTWNGAGFAAIGGC